MPRAACVALPLLLALVDRQAEHLAVHLRGNGRGDVSSISMGQKDIKDIPRKDFLRLAHLQRHGVLVDAGHVRLDHVLVLRAEAALEQGRMQPLVWAPDCTSGNGSLFFRRESGPRSARGQARKRRAVRAREAIRAAGRPREERNAPLPP